MIKKICLVQPRSQGITHFWFYIIPRLGLPLLGTILRQRGLEVEVYFGRLQAPRPQDLDKADMVGFSITATEARPAYEMARALKARRPEVTIVFGGPHATFRSEEALLHGDYVVRGEGEHTFPALIEALNQGQDPLAIPGVSARVRGSVRHGPDPDPLEALLDIVPDMSLIKGYPEAAADEALKYRLTPIVETSRGCPFGCKFCSVSAMYGKRYKTKSVQAAIDDFTHQVTSRKVRAPAIFVVDDNFGLNTDRAVSILEGIHERQLNVNVLLQLRAESSRCPELMHALARVQPHGAFAWLGLESVSDRCLNDYAKEQSFNNMQRDVEAFGDRGIEVNGNFVVGGDEDTVETVRDITRFAIRTNVLSMHMYTLLPFPGAPHTEAFRQQGRIFSEDFRLYDGHHMVFFPLKIRPSRLTREIIRGAKEFYSVGKLMRDMAERGRERRSWWKYTLVMGAVSQLYCSYMLDYLPYLEEVEDGMYDGDDRLRVDRLASRRPAPPFRHAINLEGFETTPGNLFGAYFKLGGMRA